jgi:hypothetical protein
MADGKKTYAVEEQRRTEDRWRNHHHDEVALQRQVHRRIALELHRHRAQQNISATPNRTSGTTNSIPAQ